MGINKTCITLSGLNLCGDNCNECGLKNSLENIQIALNKEKEN